MIEQKTVYSAKENAAQAAAKLERLQSYGWVIASKEQKTSERNVVNYIHLTRDLDNPENVKLKAIEDDEDDVVRAKEFCLHNQGYCDSKVLELKGKKSHIILKFFLYVILLFYSLGNLLGAFAALFHPEIFEKLGLHMEIGGGVDTEGEGAATVVKLPNGVKFFGMNEFNAMQLLGVFCLIMGLLFLIITLVVIANNATKRSVRKAQIKYFESLKDDYQTLESHLSKWDKAKSVAGFDPYSYGGFNNKSFNPGGKKR